MFLFFLQILKLRTKHFKFDTLIDNLHRFYLNKPYCFKNNKTHLTNEMHNMFVVSEVQLTCATIVLHRNVYQTHHCNNYFEF